MDLDSVLWEEMKTMATQTSSQLERMFRTGDGAFAVDQEQRIVFWNAGAEAILGYGPEEAVGRCCFEVLRGTGGPGEERCRQDCPIVNCGLQGKLSSGRSFLMTTKDGSLRWLGMTHIFLGPVEVHPVTVVHVFRDLTAEMEAKKLVQRMADQLSGLGFLKPREDGAARTDTELTEREMQVLSLLARGGSTGSIAKELTISNTTARNHIQNILSKLGVHTRLEAVAYALKRRLVDFGHSQAAVSSSGL